MEQFRTTVNVPIAEQKIGYQNKIMLIGSCFAENIGNKLKQYKFPVKINPFGITYNPISVADNLQLIIQKKNFNKSDLKNFNNKWFSFNHHSRFSNANPETCLENINTNLINAQKHLKQADYLFITFGTSWTYKHLETGKIVSNCHKLPSTEFSRHRLKVDQIVNRYIELLNSLQQHNPKLKTIFTISPIRHWKDGAHENQLSKAVLLLAIEQLTRQFTQTSYFPAYEIVIDDLRDYRFYDEDMLHPNKTAINYIWSRFVDAYIHKKTNMIMNEVEKIIKASQHRPFNDQSEEHQKFLRKYSQKIENLETKYPFLKFENPFPVVPK